MRNGFDILLLGKRGRIVPVRVRRSVVRVAGKAPGIQAVVQIAAEKDAAKSGTHPTTSSHLSLLEIVGFSFRCFSVDVQVVGKGRFPLATPQKGLQESEAEKDQSESDGA